MLTLIARAAARRSIGLGRLSCDAIIAHALARRTLRLAGSAVGARRGAPHLGYTTSRALRAG